MEVCGKIAHFLVFLNAVLQLELALGNHDDVRVTSLPGWSGSLPSAHYSGYVDVDAGRMHYVFVESENQCGNERDNVPLVLWVQGGPGCSSLLGFFTEVGTFTVVPSHDGSLTLELNAHRWSKCAHMLYWESPVGVGFSYSPAHQYKTNDSQVADMNMQFLVNWFKVFPEYSSLDFYIAGESYAGVYIPMLASRIQAFNAQLPAPAGAGVRLLGMLIGNGCIGNKVGACSDQYDLAYAIPYLHAHGLVGDEAYGQTLSQCAGQRSPTSEACVREVNALYAAVGNINVLNIRNSCRLNGTARNPLLSSRQLSKVHGIAECAVGLHTQAYLRQDDVQRAIHVKPNTSPWPWTPCSAALHAVYAETAASVLPEYERLIAGGDSRYRILVYNGDADASVPFTDNARWTGNMAGELGLRVESPWQSWVIDAQQQVGGYFTKYEKNFTFLTVHAAGHMVPMDRPGAAFEMFRRFLAGDF